MREQLSLQPSEPNGRPQPTPIELGLVVLAGLLVGDAARSLLVGVLPKGAARLVSYLVLALLGLVYGKVSQPRWARRQGGSSAARPAP